MGSVGIKIKIKINESIINTSAIIDLVQHNKNYLKKNIFVFCDLEQFKEICNGLNAAPPH